MSLEPEGRQLELLTAVLNATAGTKTKVVCVLVHGRPVSFTIGTGFPDYTSPLGQLPALLASWRSGEEGGTAIVNLIMGSTAGGEPVSPSGKLAQAWRRSAGYIHTPTSPWFQTHTSMLTSGGYFGNGDKTPLSPLFAFGHGLTYTSFNFSDVKVDTTSLPPTASGDVLEHLTLTMTVTVTNTRMRSGSTAVMAVYTKRTRGVVRNLRDLAAFTKVLLAAGETQRATIPIR